MMKRYLGVCLVFLLSALSAAAQAPSWLVDVRTGCLIWSRNGAGFDTVTWSGDCVGGAASGRGSVEYVKDGETVWKGEVGFRQGRLEGRGVLVHRSGDTLDREYHEGESEGHSIEEYADGDRFEGKYRNGKRNGPGIYQWIDGRKYDGEFKDGRMQGQGTFTFPDGSTYVGEWRSGKPNGLGVYAAQLQNGETGSLYGMWHDGCFMNGKAIVPRFATMGECGFE